jgi:hypothetical protein
MDMYDDIFSDDKAGPSDPQGLIQSIRNRVFQTGPDDIYITGVHPKHVVKAFAMWD